MGTRRLFTQFGCVAVHVQRNSTYLGVLRLLCARLCSKALLSPNTTDFVEFTLFAFDEHFLLYFSRALSLSFLFAFSDARLFIAQIFKF